MTKALRYEPATFPLTTVRGSSATYIDSDGLLKEVGANEPRIDHDPVTGEPLGLLVEEQRTNLIQNPRNLLQGGWTVLRLNVEPYAEVSYDGTLRMSKLSWNGELNPSSLPDPIISRTINVGTPVGGRTFTFSFYYKGPASNQGTSTVQFLIVGSEATSVFVPLILDGTLRRAVGVVTANPNDTSNTPAFRFDVFQNDVALSDYLFVDGFSVEEGSFTTSLIPDATAFTSRNSVATYFDSSGVLQTASVDEARDNAYGYDDTGVLRPIGLLLEPQRTNFHTHSEQLDATSSWATSLATVSANTTIAPDGATTADTITVSDTSGYLVTHRNTISFPANTDGVASFWIKNFPTGGEVKILDGSGKNLSTPTVKVFSEPVGNAWERFQIPFTSDGDGFIRILFQPNQITSFQVWGVQFEVGSYATSYIPTTTSQVTRAADVSTSPQATRLADDISIPVSDFWNSQEGTLFVEAAVLSEDDSVFSLLDDGTSLRRFFYNAGWASGAIGSYDGTYVASLSSGTKTAFRKMAVSFDSTSMTLALEGSSVSRQSSGAFLTITKLSLKGYTPSNKLYKTIKYYPVKLTEKELEELTQP